MPPKARNAHRPPKWALDPLLPGDWRDVSPEDMAEAIRIYAEDVANEHVPDFLGGADIECMRALPLSFFPGWMLFECQVGLKNGPRVLFDFVLGPDGAVLLDGTKEPLHALAKHIKCAFTDASNARDYMLFYCNGLRTEQGRFRIIQSASELAIDTATDSATRAALKKAVRALKQSDVEEEGARFLVTVLYAQSLYYTTFRVTPDGQVEMEEDHLVMEEVPVVPEYFEGPFRLVEV